MPDLPHLVVSAATLAFLLFAPVAQASDDSVKRGLQTARQACSSGHLVEADGPGVDAAPAFMTLARDPDIDVDRLRSFTMLPHPQMPTMTELSEPEIEDLIAYITSLRP